MKLAILLALSCLLVAAFASPIAPSSDESARQADSGSAPVAAAPDDDDDDDDDDDVDLDDITDDDDDDDDDDESGSEDDDDDDDEDYFERFFDDILGEEDDDDEDDSPASVAAPSPTQTVISTASKPVTSVDYASVDYTAPGETLSNSDSAGPSNYEDDITPEELAAGAVETDLVEPSNALPTADVTDPVKPEVVQPVSTPDEDDDEDDDDDDDEDDLDVSLDEDDDDDDDDEDEDEDDDDDDDEDDLEDVVSDDVIEAKRSRSLEGGNLVPPVYITKYNRFVDNILERINRILRKNYDPVNVKLHNNNNNNNKKKGHSKNNKKKNKNTRRPSGNKKRPGHRSQDDVARSTTEHAEAMVNESLAAISAQLTAGNPLEAVNATETTTTPELATTKRSLDKGPISRARPQNQNGNKKTKKNKNKGRQRPGARATLYGLSSIRRDGDVTVNMMSSHTTVRTKFTVGPLILKVEKEFGRGAKKDIRSATATTTEMTGKLNLRVLHGGAATLHSIRVMQPKQVRVESSDDHDKTREYVWKRSSHIAHVVSQKLSNATKSMLQPPPLPTSSMLA